jgi:hypothetical protein
MQAEACKGNRMFLIVVYKRDPDKIDPDKRDQARETLLLTDTRPHRHPQFVSLVQDRMPP